VLITFIQIGVFEFKTGQPSIDIPKAIVTKKRLKDKPQVNELPNIFFIILDAYARSDVLKEIYDYDNNDFLEFLTQNDFFVAKQSISNYCQTDLTLASCFNMNYIDDLIGEQVSVESNDRRPIYYLLQQNQVFRFFREQGYSIVLLSCEKELTKIIEADICLEALILNDFQNSLINSTPIPALLKIFKTSNLFDWYRKRIFYTLENLVNLCQRKEPLFIFAYITVPHPPFVFGPNGEKLYPEEKFNDDDGNWLINIERLTREQYIKGYRDQLIFINKKMKTIITKILSQSRQPPIILILGDHGPRSTFYWENPELTYMKECMTNLMAYYLPDGGHSHLNDETSSVNTFCIILNHYFGFDYDLLENRCYFSTHRYPYRFHDVTQRVKNPNDIILHLHLGLALARQRKFNDAIYHYSEILRIRPDSAPTHNELGIALATTGKTDEAILHFREALRINPDFTPAHNNLTKSLKIKKEKEGLKN